MQVTFSFRLKRRPFGVEIAIQYKGPKNTGGDSDTDAGAGNTDETLDLSNGQVALAQPYDEPDGYFHGTPTVYARQSRPCIGFGSQLG